VSKTKRYQCLNFAPALPRELDEAQYQAKAQELSGQKRAAPTQVARGALADVNKQLIHCSAAWLEGSQGLIHTFLST